MSWFDLRGKLTHIRFLYGAADTLLSVKSWQPSRWAKSNLKEVCHRLQIVCDLRVREDSKVAQAAEPF